MVIWLIGPGTEVYRGRLAGIIMSLCSCGMSWLLYNVNGSVSDGGSTAYVEVTMMCRSNGSLLGTPESLHMGTLLAKCP